MSIRVEAEHEAVAFRRRLQQLRQTRHHFSKKGMRQKFVEGRVARRDQGEPEFVLPV